MATNKGKLVAGVAVVALLVGGGFYLGRMQTPDGGQTEAPAGQSSPAAPEQPAPSPSSSPAPDNASNAPIGVSVESDTPTGEERDRRDKIIIEDTRAFDLAIADYFKQVMADNKGKKIDWQHYISASPKLPEAERKRNKEIWDKFYALCKKIADLQVPPLVRMRFYALFFDVESFGLNQDQMKVLPVHDDWDSVPFGYITEVVNPAWYAEYVEVPNDFDFRSPQALKDMPAQIRAWTTDESDEITYETIPVQGLRHLNGYAKGRAESFGGDTLKAISKHMDIKGKDFADIGSGCGFTLPLFREAIGPKAKLYAGDMDMYTVDVLKYCSKGTGTVIVQNFPTDCNLGENAFDIVNMTGVHLGLMCSDPPRKDIEDKILPWLRTIAKALRPGGLLVIHDGEWPLVERHADKVVEEAGFKKIDYFEFPESHAFVWVFKVKK